MQKHSAVLCQRGVLSISMKSIAPEYSKAPHRHLNHTQDSSVAGHVASISAPWTAESVLPLLLSFFLFPPLTPLL